MSTTGQKVGAGAVVVAVAGAITGIIAFVDNHWTGTFGPDNTSQTTSDKPSDRPSEQPKVVIPSLPVVDADIFLSRDQVPMDGDLTVSGVGFAPGQVVVIEVGNFEVARPTANNQGGFTGVTIKVPEFYRPFQKPMTVDVRASSKPDFQYRARRPLVIS